MISSYILNFFCFVFIFCIFILLWKYVLPSKEKKLLEVPLEKIKDITVFIKIIDNSPLQDYIIKKLNPDNFLSDIRKELENNVIDDTLFFSSIKSDNVFGVLNYEEEKKFLLKEIIEIENDKNILYLKLIYWKFLSNQHKLDYERIMSFDRIKIAKKQAFTIKDCGLNKIISGYKNDRLEFESKEDWLKKTNLLFSVDGINIVNFIKLGLSVGSLQNKSFNKEITSSYQITEIKRIKKITEDYGQIIPTEIILGGRVYFDDAKESVTSSIDTSNNASANISVGLSNVNVGIDFNNSERISKFYNFNHIGLLGGKHPDDKNFDERAWIESLKDYQNWECIEFRNPISIFQFLSDDLRKKIFESVGKRILHTNTKDCDYYLNEPRRYRLFGLKELPRNILETIQDEEAGCDVFASVYESSADSSKKVFFNCKILKEQSAKPSIIIHGIQKEFKPCKYNLKIKTIVIGYDTNFNFILPDTIGVEIIKDEYDPQIEPRKFYSIKLQRELDSMLAENIPFFGIPILENFNLNKSLVIGHNFRNVEDEHQIDIFSYCLEKKCYVDLPKVTFCTLIVSNYPDSNLYASLPFNFKSSGKKPYIKLDPNSESPKYKIS
ncbi:hypothetical protein RclHR1_15400003 [Rhizophagus clarus]|uniref:DUF7431 domain-containing protein n=1 Tax=Rhizophagus clarus TaxID=94130 RepID=A0A2Z6QF91_9GLOM|nr:hypothetical protein RclHR1_15400003 [Rhizophagus clarus]